MSTGRLLILDDDATVGQTLLAAAQACGFEGRLCETPAAFFAALQAWPPTHVAIDLHLAGSDGLQVLREMAALPGCGATVIVCSGSGVDELEAALAQARTLGLPTAGALTKPFRLAALRALLTGPPGAGG